ncbi:MAG: NAD(P)-dependent oxidoreductase, partial [Chloroflexota bacterium]|nr:NAD(P)-dependent oxidoreductase [Chloroflexota bacterium]
MKRILITGGAGSVGRELSNALIENGDQVRIFDLPFMDFSVFEGHASVEIVKGDITDLETVQAAVKDMEIVVHLAALLPPNSEKNRERTFAINVGGTQNLLEAIKKEGSQSRMIFASSVATYGNTMDEEPPVRVDHHQSAVDIYGETKIESERIMIASGVPYTILRISGISIPAFLDPPEVWPFMHDQRIEFVNRADVFTALFASVQQDKAANKIFNIAGGESWRMLGHE